MKQELTFIAPCLFGLESIVAHELRDMGLNAQAENGRVRFLGTLDDAARANLWLRCAERVLLVTGEFEARSFDELFEGTKSIRWEDFIPKEGAFPVKGHCLNSKLMSVSDCQAIIKKAVAARLGEKNNVTWLSESAEKYQLQFSIMKDRVTLMIDTSGEGLHKRGYRREAGGAPLRETLCAAMVDLSRWRPGIPLLDPMCGSGTIAIEAALKGKNRAPGINRPFAMEQWQAVSPDLFSRLRDEAKTGEYSEPFSITASDIDGKMAALAAHNADLAGVGNHVRVKIKDAAAICTKVERGILITNPPYGERLLDIRRAQELYGVLGRLYSGLSGWGAYIITPNEDFESFFGRKADKKRKLYNGMIKCDLYQYFRAREERTNANN